MNRFRIFLARFMIAGTLVSAAIIAIGLLLFLSAHAGQTPGDHIFTGEPKYLRNPVDMLVRAFDLHATGERLSLTMIGIFLLLLNPPARVFLAGCGFLVEKNRLYAAISAIVFLVLAISYFL